MSPSHPTVRIAFLSAALFLTACTDPRKTAQAQIYEIGVPRLRYDAALLHKQLFAGPSTEYLTLKPSQWPPSFKLLSPQQVGASLDGFSLAISGEASSESGIHITPTGMSLAPKATHAKFEKIADGIYWYSISK